MQIERQATRLSAGLKSSIKSEVNNFRASGKRLGKWILVLEKWKEEALLIRKLTRVSTIGYEQENKSLNVLDSKLDGIIKFQIDELSTIFQGMLYDFKFLKNSRVLNRDRMKLAKSQMKRISEDYQLIKEKMLREIIREYPLQFI